MAITLAFYDVTNLNQTINLSKSEHLVYILNKMDDDTEVVNELISDYENLYKTNIYDDKQKYLFSYLSHLNLIQAINLYDGLLSEQKNNMINVIITDHTHLHELVNIHNYLQIGNIIPESQMYS